MVDDFLCGRRLRFDAELGRELCECEAGCCRRGVGKVGMGQGCMVLQGEEGPTNGDGIMWAGQGRSDASHFCALTFLCFAKNALNFALVSALAVPCEQACGQPVSLQEPFACQWRQQ